MLARYGHSQIVAVRCFRRLSLCLRSSLSAEHLIYTLCDPICLEHQQDTLSITVSETVMQKCGPDCSSNGK